jgi:hypothetical protein
MVIAAQNAFNAISEAAMTLVPEGWIVHLHRDFSDDDYWCRAILTDSFSGYDDTDPLRTVEHRGGQHLALALCIAALRARGVG